MDPNHFLLTEGLFTRWLKFLMPVAPADGQHASRNWIRPQEDEFALCMLAPVFPYLTIAFPEPSAAMPRSISIWRTYSPTGLRRWKRAFKDFLKRVTYKSGKRLVLKSPPHTARIKTLKAMFPDAIFIHIMRDPYVIFPSTINLWQTLHKTLGAANADRR